MNCGFKMYHQDFIKRFANGDTKLKDDEIKYLLERKKLFKEVYKNLEIYDLDSINGCFFLEQRFVNDLCHKLMEEKGYKITICINGKFKSCSVRSNLNGLHIGEMLSSLDLGAHAGGHTKKLEHLD